VTISPEKVILQKEKQHCIALLGYIHSHTLYVGFMVTLSLL